MASILVLDAFKDYDVASAGYTYGKFAAQFQSLPKPAKTSGSSTTTTDVATGDNFATPLGVGDELYEPSGNLRRFVTAKADDTSITVSSAWNLGSTGKNLQFRKFFSGTTSTDGWIDVSNLTDVTVYLQVDTINATSVTFTIEGKVPGSAPATIYTTAAQTAVTVNTEGVSSLAPIKIAENLAQIRIGVKVNTDGGVQSVSARVYGVMR